MHVLALLALGTLSYFLWDTFRISNNYTDEDFREYATTYGNVTGAWFCVLSATLAGSYAFLVCTLRKYQGNTTNVRKRIKCIFLSFFLSYIFRTAFTLADG